MGSMIFFRRFISLALFSVLVCGILGSCIFSPKEGKKTDPPKPLWEDPINPGAVISNLEVAFNNKDIDFYEKCMHKDYYWMSPSQTDSLPESWPLTTDLRVVKDVFADAISFEFIANQNSFSVEYGSNMENIPPGSQVSEEHPNSIWYKYNYSITMHINLKTYGEMQVNQYMTFVMVEEPKGYWSIIRWIDSTDLSG